MGSQSFTIYNTTTGEVIRTGSCPTDDVSKQVQHAGESVLEGFVVDHSTHKVDIHAKCALKLSNGIIAKKREERLRMGHGKVHVDQMSHMFKRIEDLEAQVAELKANKS